MGQKRQMPATWLAKQRARWNKGDEGRGSRPAVQQAARTAKQQKGSVAHSPKERSILEARGEALKEIIRRRQERVQSYLTGKTNNQGIDVEGKSKDKIRPERSRATGARSIRNQDNSISAATLAIGVGPRQQYAANRGGFKKGVQYVKNDTSRNIHSLAFKSLKAGKKDKKKKK